MSFIIYIKKTIFITIYFLLVLCGLYACASIGSPGGGEMDFEPPHFVNSDPKPNTVYFDKNKISLFFDEYLIIEQPSEKVIITPPQKRTPIIKGVGKKITVELRDSLVPNTTYTLDFTNAIVDNNEKNPLEGFTFAFSTGDVIDSLMISGLVLNAEDLEPVTNTLIGIHSDLSDSAFISTPFLRTSKTNDRGQFKIRNIAPGTYRLFALNDLNRDYKFDQPGEAIAFYDSLIIPSFEPALRMDTVWIDSLTIDTIKAISYTRFTPDNIILKLFNEAVDQQYFTRAERISPNQFTLNFNSDTGMPPKVSLLNNKDINTDWYILEQSPDKKTMIYWITDSLVYQQDTLNIIADYIAHDSLHHLTPIQDTLKLYQRQRKPQKEKKNKDNKEAEKIDFLEINITSSYIDVFDTVKIKFSEPLFSLDEEKIQIFQKVDTIWESRDFPIVQDSLDPKIFYVSHLWPYNQEYKIAIDSASIYSIYNKWNKNIETTFRTRAEDEYGQLYIQISGIEGPGFGELLNASGKKVKESILEDGELIFENIKPGKYYLRYIEDKNENGKWDTGLYINKLQPENVYYYPGFFEIKKYMEWEQSWNITQLPIEQQKPLEITKNKPVQKRTRRNNEDQRNTNTRNTTNRNMSVF